MKKKKKKKKATKNTAMATTASTSSHLFSSTFVQSQKIARATKCNSFPSLSKSRNLTARAAKLPAGVEMPKKEPKLPVAFWGFTKTAEIWNSRACMIGLIGTFIVELIFNRGILQMIGVDVGKGLDIPL